MKLSTLFSAVLSVGFVHGASYCPPLGPVLAAPRSPSSTDAVKNASKQLEKSIQQMLAGSNTSAISVSIKSIHETEPLFTSYHTPKVKSDNGTRSIDSDTIFRAGSISKLFTALAIMQTDSIDLDDSILIYVPELQNETGVDNASPFRWEDITIGGIMAHLGGLPRETGQELSIINVDWTADGLPPVPKNTSRAACGYIPGARTCDASDLIQDVGKTQALYRPYTTPAYSNAGYALLGQVLEAATGEKFAELIEENIFEPVGMNNSNWNGPSKKFNASGFVPYQDQSWNISIGSIEPTGGLFTTANDMLALGEAILKNKLLSESKTREWMKPVSHSSSLGMSVGRPWEIARGENVTKDGRIVDVYSKGGDVGFYHNLFALVPDYDVVLMIFTAGQEFTLETAVIAASAVMKTMLPALEAAGKDEAEDAGYTGLFKDSATNSSMKVKIDDGPGLVIDEFYARGFDVKHHTSTYNSVGTPGQAPRDKIVDARMYPSNTPSFSNQSRTTAWRANFDLLSDADKRQADSSLAFSHGSCLTFLQFDTYQYDYMSMIDFEFTLDAAGQVESVTNKAFNLTMRKVSADSGSTSSSSGTTSSAAVARETDKTSGSSSMSEYLGDWPLTAVLALAAAVALLSS